MKITACIFISLLANAASIDINGETVAAYRVDKSELKIWVREEKIIFRVDILDGFSADDFTLTYMALNDEYEQILFGETTLCDNDASTEAGSVAILFRKLVFPGSPNCPIEKGEYKDEGQLNWSATIAGDFDFSEERVEFTMMMEKNNEPYETIQTNIRKK